MDYLAILNPKIREKHRQFYLVVYTQTDAHQNYICGGGLDLGLNSAGIEEGQKLARRFTKNPLKIKKIICSPELRAVQMSDILHDEMRTKIGIRSELADQQMGDWEGHPIDPALDFKNPPRGETHTEFKSRIAIAAQAILQEEQVVLLVTHLRVARFVFELLGLEEEPLVPGQMISIDLPAGEGRAHLRVL